jgi:hypothetical protein
MFTKDYIIKALALINKSFMLNLNNISYIFVIAQYFKALLDNTLLDLSRLFT